MNWNYHNTAHAKHEQEKEFHLQFVRANSNDDQVVMVEAFCASSYILQAWIAIAVLEHNSYSRDKLEDNFD